MVGEELQGDSLHDGEVQLWGLGQGTTARKPLHGSGLGISGVSRVLAQAAIPKNSSSASNISDVKLEWKGRLSSTRARGENLRH